MFAKQWFPPSLPGIIKVLPFRIEKVLFGTKMKSENSEASRKINYFFFPPSNANYFSIGESIIGTKMQVQKLCFRLATTLIDSFKFKC